jgi:hypothetical protein
VAQWVERFEPSEEEIASARSKAQHDAKRRAAGEEPLHLRASAAHISGAVIEELKHVLESYRGHAEVVLELLTGADKRKLYRLGEAYRVQHTPIVRAELEAVLAPALAASA